MSTATDLAVLQTVRTRLLSYVPTSGSTLAARLGTAAGAATGGKLYIDQAPDVIQSPSDSDPTLFGVLRMIQRRSEGDDGGYGRRAEIEVQLRARPRSKASTVKSCGDVIEQAWRSWVDTASGVIVAVQGLTRETVFLEAPADRETVVEQLVLPCYYYPTYLP